MNCPAEETGQEDTDSPERTDNFVKLRCWPRWNCSNVSDGNGDTPLPVRGGPQSIKIMH
jgi:hypothetical protein